MKSAIYAGSFEPWSFGHQFVLESALDIFSSIHVLVAVNPSKKLSLDADVRARIIAHQQDPFTDWSLAETPFQLESGRLIIETTDGLVAHYAQEQGIGHLVRGLRSTSDFEAEFNLYFSNRAINPSIQTWTIMCPPELLHCSSTYVRTVAGKSHVPFVGTCFLAQAELLDHSRTLGRLFDLIAYASRCRFEVEPADLTPADLLQSLQLCYATVTSSNPSTFPSESLALLRLKRFLHERTDAIKAQLKARLYPGDDVDTLWAIVALCTSGVWDWESHPPAPLGKTGLTLFDRDSVRATLAAWTTSQHPLTPHTI